MLVVAEMVSHLLMLSIGEREQYIGTRYRNTNHYQYDGHKVGYHF